MTTVRQIVTRAFGELMYLAEGETPSAQSMQDGVTAFNAMLANWRTMGMIIPDAPGFPASSNWRGDWASNTVYAVDDGVCRSGSTYKCKAVHTSSLYNDKPGVSPNWATYWDFVASLELTQDDTVPLDLMFHRGLVSLLAIELAPTFGVAPSKQTEKKASEGMTSLLAAFLPINPVRADNGIIRMPSQIWPYNIDQVS